MLVGKGSQKVIFKGNSEHGFVLVNLSMFKLFHSVGRLKGSDFLNSLILGNGVL
jgi:hypothetical protein